MENFKQYLDFIVEIDKMKNIFRRTKLIGIDRRENDAEHTFHIALMAVLLRDFRNGADELKSIKMLLVHDLIEIYAGDTFAYDTIGNLSKKERELKSAKKLYSLLPKKIGDELMDLWLEFEEMSTQESIFANAMDRLQPIIHNLYNNGGTWNEFNVNLLQLKQRMLPIKLWNEDIYNFILEKAKQYIK